jgi:UrcA family protein
MKSTIITAGKSFAIALGLVIANGVALADEPIGVTIEAQHSKIVGRNSLGGPIEQISLVRRINYADLDLTDEDDAAALKVRIAEAANALCNKLDKMYPFSTVNHGDFVSSCISKTKSDAMKQVQAAIATAIERRDASLPAG